MKNIGKLQIKDGRIELDSLDSGAGSTLGVTTVYNKKGNIEIENGKFITNYHFGGACIYNIEGNINIKNANIECSSESELNGIYNTGNLKIEDISINMTGKSTKGIDNLNYIQIKKCQIFGDTSYYDTAVAINNQDKATLILGVEEEKDENLYIKGHIGISNIGNLEFYNGRIQGRTAIKGTVSKIRDGYVIASESIDKYDEIVFLKQREDDYVVQVDDKKYTTITINIKRKKSGIERRTGRLG